MRTTAARQTIAFARAARAYWLDVYPQVRRELSSWHDIAVAIPDPTLREAALLTQRTKAGHAEGAAAFAVFVPRAGRRAYVRLLVALELLVDYLDTISEAQAEDVLANNLQLHRAMAVALRLEPERDDYYALHPQGDDGGYIAAHTSVCRELVTALPSYCTVREPLRRLVSCYAESQSLHHTRGSLEDAMRAEQTRSAIARYPELEWREIVVAGSSTLAIHALLVAAIDPGLSEGDAERTVATYYPSASSLHIMLDSLVDLARDRANGDVNQIDNYDSWSEACERLAFLASRSRHPAAQVPERELHEVLLAGMAGYYLAQPEAWKGGRSTASRDVLEALGPMARVARLVHRLSRNPRAALQPAAG